MAKLSNVERNGELTREFMGEQDGWETYRVRVSKNEGELVEYIEVTVPASVDKLLELDAEERQAIMQDAKVKLIADKRNTYRQQVMVSEDEKEEKAEKAKKDVAKKLELMKSAGMSIEDLKSLLDD